VTDLYESHVDLYDLAFGWDVDEEVAWLIDRLGRSCRSVLEPGCGSGRILAALAALGGVDVTGIDYSTAMLAAADRRLEAAGVPGELVLSDMAAFELGRAFDGAICPINTLGYLSPDDLSAHMNCMAQHLKEGGRYLVQLDLLEDTGSASDQPASRWEASQGDTTVRVSWSIEELDVGTRRQTQLSRIEILAGSRAGEVVDEVHSMTAWTPDAWAEAISATAFVQTATYDGNLTARPRVAAGTAGPLLWHELTRTPAVE
jgi:cyclopropane fatty-acyl-phospholipid synthase-like methyltransferase